MDSTAGVSTEPVKQRASLRQVAAVPPSSQSKPTTSGAKPGKGKAASKPAKTAASNPDAEVDALLAKAARKLIRTHGESIKLRKSLKEAKKEWSKQLGSARSEMKTALKDAHKAVDTLRDTADEVAAVLRITEAVTSQQQALDQKSTSHHEAVACKARIVEAIEGTPPGNCVALQLLGAAHQNLEEVKAGRKAALHAILLDLEESEARGRKQMDGALQLSLFE